ncbi:MAG: hypothetical protein LBN23_07225 [Paludibacter sp.]|jgi:hypothetical protein|nr:hypothetical protein [Paludibacter sp.]
MKRISLISAIIAFSAIWLNAQTVFDALKAADSDLNGSARYSAMAGAFGALGGDVSAIKDNPAGLGVFLKSEISLTGDWLSQNAKSQWNDSTNGSNRGKFGLNNFSLVFATPLFKTSGLVYSNFSFSYNKIKNFNRSIYIASRPAYASITDYYAAKTPINAQGNINFDNEQYSYLSVMAYQGYLIDPIFDDEDNLTGWQSLLKRDEYVVPDYTLKESGGIDEYAFTWAGNVSNRFFLGVSLNIRSVNYGLYSIYNEEFTGGSGMTMHNWVNIKGSGVNANFGLIYVPIDFLRIGASLQTPTAYYLRVSNYAELDYVDFQDNNRAKTLETPTGNIVKSSLYSPFQANGSIAVLFGKNGLLSAEYVYKNYTGMYFASASSGSSASYAKENNEIGSMLNSTSTFKLGGEYKVTDNIALRAGYAYATPAANEHAQNIPYPSTARTDTEYFKNNGSRYITTGFGYRESFWYIDFAFTNQSLKETFYAFNPAGNDFSAEYISHIKPASVTTNFNNFIVTLGLRF